MPPNSGCQEVRFPGFPISQSVKGPETVRLSELFQNVRPSKVQFRFPNRQFGEAAAVPTGSCSRIWNQGRKGKTKLYLYHEILCYAATPVIWTPSPGIGWTTTGFLKVFLWNSQWRRAAQRIWPSPRTSVMPHGHQVLWHWRLHWRKPAAGTIWWWWSPAPGFTQLGDGFYQQWCLNKWDIWRWSLWDTVYNVV